MQRTMSDQKCTFVGCKNEAKVKATQNWGKGGEICFCEKHLPEWAKKSDNSPVTTLLGVTASFYTVIERA